MRIDSSARPTAFDLAFFRTSLLGTRCSLLPPNCSNRNAFARRGLELSGGLMMHDPTSSIRAIAIDPDADNAIVLVKALQLFNCQTIVLQDYQRLPVSVQVHCPSIVFASIALHEPEQVQALQRIAVLPPAWRVPIVVITGHARQCDRDRLLALGCDALIAKPYMLDELDAALKLLVPQRFPCDSDTALVGVRDSLRDFM